MDAIEKDAAEFMHHAGDPVVRGDVRIYSATLQQLAALIRKHVAAEREAIAKMIEETGRYIDGAARCDLIAAAIRQRGNA